MNKQIIFNPELVPLVKSGQKTTTWRLTDKWNLQKDDVVDLIDRKKMIVFANAKIMSVKVKTFAKLTADDKAGHEKFKNDEEMFKTYSGYYKIKVGPRTKLKIVKFRIIQTL